VYPGAAEAHSVTRSTKMEELEFMEEVPTEILWESFDDFGQDLEDLKRKWKVGSGYDDFEFGGRGMGELYGWD
jgi:hypothetical protein